MITDFKLDENQDMLVAPLLMIPFVENSFKHGASNAMNHTRIFLQISTEQDHLIFKITNEINPIPEHSTERVKIGLKNVKKRLQILYPDKHSLEFMAADGIYTVTMIITLDKPKFDTKTDNVKANLSTPAYA
jgi:LytS/YehU family sensor histidine kinase